MKKPDKDMVQVTVQIPKEYYEIAKNRLAPQVDEDTPEAYLNALLNGALHNEVKEFEEWFNLPPPLPMIVLMPRDDDDGERFVEDEGGGLRLADEEDDLDDDIPF